MPSRKQSRPVPWRADFKAALALEGQTVKAFAERQAVTPTHLRAVLRGERESDRLMGAMLALVAKHFPRDGGADDR